MYVLLLVSLCNFNSLAMTPKYFVEQIRKLAARLTNIEARVPAGKIKVKFNPSDTIAAGEYALETVTVPGVVPGDAVAISYPTSVHEPLIASGTVTSANTVRVWVYNAHDTEGVTMAGDWYVHVIK